MKASSVYQNPCFCIHLNQCYVSGNHIKNEQPNSHFVISTRINIILEKSSCVKANDVVIDCNSRRLLRSVVA